MNDLSLLSGAIEDIVHNMGKNEVIQGKGFHVSYVAVTSAGTETALVKDNKFFILLGDYRKEYKKVVKKGYRECKKLFTKLVADGAEESPYSN